MRLFIPALLLLFSCKNNIDLTELFAPPTQEEKQKVLTNWKNRDVGVYNWEIISSHKQMGYTVDVVSQSVNGYKHYALVRHPLNYNSSRKYALLMVNHGGVDGCSSKILNQYSASSYDQSFIVIPSYIGESLDTQEFGLGILTSEGEKSFFDKDLDNVIALLNATLLHYPYIDKQNISIFGESRGACTAYMASIRDQRFSKGVFFYGTTDHLSYPNLQEIVYSRRKGDPLPWVVLLTAVIDYEKGDITLADARLKLLQKSPLHFADLLPKEIQIHHGTKDNAVYVENSRRLSRILEKDTSMTYFKYFEYEKGGHGTHMPELDERKASYLSYP